MGLRKAGRRAGRRGKARHLLEHIGQVLRNRTREELLIPVPTVIVALLEMTKQSTAPT
jgi:hypothetical protein